MGKNLKNKIWVKNKYLLSISGNHDKMKNIVHLLVSKSIYNEIKFVVDDGIYNNRGRYYNRGKW